LGNNSDVQAASAGAKLRGELINLGMRKPLISNYCVLSKRPQPVPNLICSWGSLISPASQDYGQVAVYKGTIPQCEAEYQLDARHVFVTNQPKLICGNTAAILGEGGVSWLLPHFHVQGDRSVRL